MKIGLINLYSTRNAGDAAIYAALVEVLHRHELVALADGALRAQLPGVATAPLHTPCDAYISVGGDIFNNARPWLVTRTFLGNLAQLARHADRTILFGQSIPASCRGLAFLALCKVLKTLPSVTVRDGASLQRLRQAGVDAQLSYDLAFVHRPTPAALSEAAALFDSLRLTPERSVLLSLRGFDAMYPHDNARFIDNMVYLCRMLRNVGLQPALLLQSAAEGDDAAVAQAIVTRIGQLPVIDALAAPPSLASHEFLQGLLALAGLAVAVRYHTAVLALASGRLPYNLYYSNKGRDLSARLGVPGCDLVDFDPNQGIAEMLEMRGRSFADQRTRQSVESQLLSAIRQLRRTARSVEVQHPTDASQQVSP